MSNRSNYNSRQDGNRGFNRGQKRFVAKTPHNSSTREPMGNPPLTTALRNPTSDDSIANSASSETRVRRGEDGNWVSNMKPGGNFVNYLPQDEAVAAGLGVEDGALDPVESQRVVDLLNRELSRLLKLNPKNFWREVASDTSLHDFLDSFLKFRSRWYDFPHHGAQGTVAGIIVGELELARRVFMVLYRISSSRDPGARTCDSLSAKEHAALLQEKKLLDLPKLLDICAIYGHENEELTGELIMNAMKAQPTVHENISTAVSQFLSIIHTMHQRCNSSLDALYSSEGHRDNQGNRLYSDISEVLDFINDAVSSLHAFVNAYNPAAVYFCCPVEMSYGNEEVLSVLTRVHDSLLPSLQQGFRHIFSANMIGIQDSFGGTLSNISSNFKALSLRIAEMGWKLMELCYLGNGAFEGSHSILTATKIFPYRVEDPAIRGDILVQTFREINGDVSGHIKRNNSIGTFLQNVEQNYGVLSRLNALRDSGWIIMDDENFQYLSRIMMPPSESLRKKFNLSVTEEKSKGQIDEDDAIRESKITQIKDLFPDYGKGFLAACLEVYNQNEEEVIQRILEGTLHEELQSLDISLDKIPPPTSSPPSLSRKDKGKGILVEAPATLSSKVDTTAREQQTERSMSSSSSVGRFTRKSKTELPHSKTLDSRSDKDTAKTAILASQYEYEDEYDDSFDDLGLSVVEAGFEDSEILGDNISSTSGKSWGSETENPGPNNHDSKWGSKKKPQFYVKDGKNYSYKVSGSVAVANYREASLINQVQKDLIHGLGRGGNLPLGAAKALMEPDEQQNHEAFHVSDIGGRGKAANARGRGRRGSGANVQQGEVKAFREANEKPDEDASDVNETGGRGRGRGRRGGGGNHYRKDRAMKKHFAGLGNF